MRHVVRMGAGYDNVDLDACSAAAVVVSNCPDAWTEEVLLSQTSISSFAVNAVDSLDS